MKKSTMFLSLVMMLGLSVSLFAEVPQEKSSDCMIPPPPQCQQERDCNDEFMPFWNIDMFQKDCRPCEPNTAHFEKGKFGKFFCDEKFKNLNLSDNQKEALKALNKANFEADKELVVKFKTKVKALNDELLKEKYSPKEVKNITKEIKNLSAKLIDNKAAKKEGIRKILTAEQYNKIFKVKTHFDILAERLGLSAEQKEKFVKILENKKEKEMSLKQQLREKDMLLKKEFDKENIDKNAIAKLSDEISNITKDLFKLDIDTKIELKELLTVEQYNKFIKPRPNPVKPVKPVKPIIYEPTACDKNIDKK